MTARVHNALPFQKLDAWRDCNWFSKARSKCKIWPYSMSLETTSDLTSYFLNRRPFFASQASPRLWNAATSHSLVAHAEMEVSTALPESISRPTPLRPGAEALRTPVDLPPPISLPVANLSSAMPVQSHPTVAAALQLSSLQSLQPPKSGAVKESKAEVRRARR